MPLEFFPWEPRFAKAGLEQAQLYVLRPDGHTGFKGGLENFPQLAVYLERWSVAAQL